MIYITVRQSPMYRQMTLEDLLFSRTATSSLLNDNTANTRTYETEYLSRKFREAIDTAELISKLREYNAKTEEFHKVPRETLYHTYQIPKKSRGFRRIDEPCPELMESLRELKKILENDFGALYHTSAFAYVKKRSILSAMQRHQANESKWFAKYDLTNFFGNTTLDFVIKMFSMIYPFSEVIKLPSGERELRRALDFAFLNGGLPQGTPISPIITNVMMIPVDFKLSNALRNFEEQQYVYTRYADDFTISSKYGFDFRKVETLIKETLSSFEAPFSLKDEKTRYGSSSGSNWNLGLMLNKDNEITVGSKRKRQFQAALSSYVMDKKNGITWDISDVQILEGHRSYIKMIEGDTVNRIVEHIDKRFGVNSVELIKEDLRRT